MNVIIPGASGNIASDVIDILMDKDGIHLTLFVRHKRKLRNKNLATARIIEGDVLNYQQLKQAIAGQDIVYANLAGDLEAMAKNIVKAMAETETEKLIFISSIGIYDSPLRPVLKPYRKAADLIEASDPSTDVVHG
jgi:putative NADH-flavin reductase